MATHISLFGGPGSGKSTIASGLFYKLKTQHAEVELVTEYAKDLTYSKDFMTLSDQLMVLAKQHHKWFKLDDQVQYTVSDAPFLLSAIYAQEKPHFNRDKFVEFVVDTYKRFDTVNIFIERDESHYQQYGRNEDLMQALAIDDKIIDVLEENEIPFIVFPSDNETVTNILKHLSTNEII